MDRLTQAVTAYMEEKKYLPGENLCDLKDALVERGLLDHTSVSDEQLAQVLTSLVQVGKLKLHVRKGQFLHVHPVIG